MSTWNKEHDPWVLSLDSQSVVLNTSGTYVPVDLEIDVTSGSSGTLSGNSASVDSINITTGSGYFTSTPTTQQVVVRADASSSAVTLSGFSAGWISSGVTELSGDSTSDTETLYIKDVSLANNVTTDSTNGTEIIGTAGWANSVKLSGIAPTTSSTNYFNIYGSSSATTYAKLDTLSGDANFTINTDNVDVLTIVADETTIDTIGVQWGNDNILLVGAGALNTTEFKQGSSTIAGDSITITGPSAPITVSGGGWNTNTKTINISLSAAVIPTAGATTLTQISGGVISGGTTYLGFSSSSTTTVTSSGFVEEDDSITITDSEIQTAIPYYDGTINH